MAGAQCPICIRNLSETFEQNILTLRNSALTCVALIDERQFHRLARDMPNVLRQRAHLGAFLLVGWGDLHCWQVARRIHRHVHLAALLALVAIVAST
ncbi:hypothetical protein DXO170_06060 [Xanthomonas oryzae pv. oryzae]|uniref:Uncharacterized protein n=1 Tax=Xanthomonas oryzae pv. oryzae TaxID=64187 RepID=A0A854CKF6_XANOO|nr:hypothetical protein AZ54_01800 [Xanthomonas oryzae pv. oryzae PXO86]ALZ70404.1 hypothetical protein APZ20_01620 [Xanthomonas oryzae pv. oryzae]AOS04256.1 hypothetical protein ATY42_21575 [Xanthomonas oryzae pv. oryzae]AOS05075.1 hypothetical protein ATY43_01685 [Xanthomonas oryzae pv. oryzae]AOS09232.1 hypothetical protein ATY44_01650 [Xanthomonas oryzae pv. oryzae]